MPFEYLGRGDPKRTIELLWGIRERGARGPKPGLTVDRIVNAAIEIADAEGLEGLSMRRVAERLSVGTMSLYRYVPGKAELLDVMIDRISDETERPSCWFSLSPSNVAVANSTSVPAIASGPAIRYTVPEFATVMPYSSEFPSSRSSSPSPSTSPADAVASA